MSPARAGGFNEASRVSGMYLENAELELPKGFCLLSLQKLKDFV